MKSLGELEEGASESKVGLDGIIWDWFVQAVALEGFAGGLIEDRPLVRDLQMPDRADEEGCSGRLQLGALTTPELIRRRR